ncbi:hypothetical protein Avbf_11405, partial [Armadillidium vulgare]
QGTGRKRYSLNLPAVSASCDGLELRFTGDLLREKPLEEESKRDSKEEVKDDDNQSSGLLGGVKLRSTGLANNLKSPTNGFSRSKSPVNRNSNPSHDAETADSSPSSNNSNCKPKPQIKGLKPKAPPPLLGPKPRPKSAFSLEHRAASDEVEDDDDGLTSHKSVRELAASLASKGVTSPNSLSNINNNNNFPAVDESEKKKSSSLPRTPAAVPAAGGLDSLSPSPPVHPFVEIPQEEEIVSLQKDETTTPIELPTALYRQTSQNTVPVNNSKEMLNGRKPPYVILCINTGWCCGHRPMTADIDFYIV